MPRTEAQGTATATAGRNVAQATASATSMTGGVIAHPAHIHRGTCANLDPNPQYPLSPVGLPVPSGAGETPVAATPPLGANGAIPVEESVTVVKGVTIKQLLASPHAINVHASATDLPHYIACGNVGGTVTGGSLAFGLAQQNNSGDTGVALLSDGGDGLRVVVYLIHTGGGTSSPAA